MTTITSGATTLNLSSSNNYSVMVLASSPSRPLSRLLGQSVAGTMLPQSPYLSEGRACIRS